jgi:fructokinase
MDIVSVGETLIDFKQTGHLAFQGFEGGSPMNVAIAAARLNPKVGFVGQVSNDIFGQALRAYLKKNRVNTKYLLEHDAPSTLAFVAEIDGDAHFSFMNYLAADTLYDPRPRPKLPKSVKFLQFGSISLLQEPTSSSIVDLVASHQDRCAIIFDPNVRPALIPDKTEYERKLKTWLSLAHLVKVSTQDLSWLYPNRTAAALAKRWLEFGPEAVIVTSGSKGASLYRKGKATLHASAPKITVVDSVGAGDTFTGAMMVALLDHQAQYFAKLSEKVWQHVLTFATYAAALNCTRAGANPPRRDELVSFMKQ